MLTGDFMAAHASIAAMRALLKKLAFPALPALPALLEKPRLTRLAASGIRLGLCLALLFVATLEAWLIDDAKITFRQVWNFIHGDGMTFHYGERVQAFTHPAWFFLLSGVAFVTRELFVSTLALSILLSLAAVGLLLAAERRACGIGGGGVEFLC